MMILEIKKYPHPILRKKCKKVEKIDFEIKKLVEDLIETMQKNQGIGLSAPQVGVLKRVIVIQTKDGARDFINPQILKKSKRKETLEEGCLSFPGIYLKIKRPAEIEIAAQSLEGPIEEKFSGLEARVLQHEIDHLDGILILDRLSFWQKIFKKEVKSGGWGKKDSAS